MERGPPEYPNIAPEDYPRRLLLKIFLYLKLFKVKNYYHSYVYT